MTRFEASRVLDGIQVAQDPQILGVVAGRVLAEVLSAAYEVDGVVLTPGQVSFRVTVVSPADPASVDSVRG